MVQVSFKERVKNILISEAKKYKRNYVDYDYLVCSDAFKMRNFYIIDAKEDNYQHLTGVNSLISPQEFFDKCFNGTLQESDFNFLKRGQSEKSVKGSVRRKISVLPNMTNLFQSDFIVQETFIKNRVTCILGTTDTKCTIGFVNPTNARPKSLIKGDELDVNKSDKVSLLLRKKSYKDKFDEIVIGDKKTLSTYYQTLENYIDEIFIIEKDNEVAVAKE